MVKKAIGQRGSWFASVKGEQLPCVHKYWLKRLNYHDPFVRHEDGWTASKIGEFVDAVLEGKRVILTDDEPHFGPNGYPIGFTRKSYIAVYEIEDVQYDEMEGLRFRLAKRIDDLE